MILNMSKFLEISLCVIAFGFLFVVSFMSEMHIFFKVFLPGAAIALYLIVTSSPKFNHTPVVIPDEAKKVLRPDGQVYLNVWKAGDRVRVVFSNIPHVQVCFDHRICREFGEALTEI